MPAALFPPRPSLAAHHARRAFTLLELIAVMTLIAVFAGVIGFAFMRGGGVTVGLQSAQSTLVGLLTLARGHAATSGREAGVFVATNVGDRESYLRYLVPAVDDGAGGWKALTTGVYLSAGCYVFPYAVPTSSSTPVAIESGTAVATKWGTLNSAAFGPTTLTAALNSSSATSWSRVIFTPRGTTSGGQIVLAEGRKNSPGDTVFFVFLNPDNVRGVALSGYGLVRVVNDYEGFQP